MAESSLHPFPTPKSHHAPSTPPTNTNSIDCKYTYATWCPTCERDSPRRRTRSDSSASTNHSNTPISNSAPCANSVEFGSPNSSVIGPLVCRRRQREMKSFGGHGMIGRSENEYENGVMDYEVLYDVGKEEGRWGGAGGGCCRVGGRVNLCELPTTYISGKDNCQNMTVNNCQNGQPTSVNYHHNTTKSTSEACYDQQQPLTTQTSDTAMSNHHQSPGKVLVPTARPTLKRAQTTKASMEVSLSKIDVNSVLYDTCSYLDSSKASYNTEITSNLRERYQQDMETLRNKLKELKSSRYNEYIRLHPPMTVKNLDKPSTNHSNPHHAPSSTTNQSDANNPPSNTNNHQPTIRIIENVAEYKRNLIGSQSTTATANGGIANGGTANGGTANGGPANGGLVSSQGCVVAKMADDSEAKLMVPRTRESSCGVGVVVTKVGGAASGRLRSKLSAVKMRKRRGGVGGGREVAAGKVACGSSSDFTESECSDDSEAEYSRDDDISIADESEPSTEAELAAPEQTAAARAHTAGLVTSRMGVGAGDQQSLWDLGIWPLRESLFAHIPPYISFNSYDATSPYVLPIGKKYLKWKLSTITPVVVRKTLINTGFSLVRKSNDWCGTWGKHMKSPMFKTLKYSQKLNHFAGTFQIGRKDRLWRNMQRLSMKHGQKEFGFLPQTFVLPQDLKLLKHSWLYKNGSGGEKWIIKPPASARGVGIKVINRWSQLPKRMSLIVQRYISDPYLINGSKFDLRLYVLVTSFNPLRIYLYPDGLARFASAKYSADDRDLRDRYMHLTNYSINKLSSQYTANEDANACQGHKWTLTKLWDYLASQGINTRQIWSNLHQLVIKTILSGESPIVQLCAEHVASRYNCYELFGVDVLLDAELRPWLLEVNISPSLHSASPLDAHVKGPLVQALMNLVQFHLPPRVKKVANTPPVLDPRLYSVALTKKERTKHNRISQFETRSEYLSEILDNLTGDDVRILTQAEDELTVKGPFERIFPTAKTHKYLEFIEPRYYNRLCDAWESMFEKNRKPGIKMLQSLCVQKVHLKVASQSSVAKKSQSMINTQLVNLQPSTTDQHQLLQLSSTLSTAAVDDDNTDNDEEAATMTAVSTVTMAGAHLTAVNDTVAIVA